MHQTNRLISVISFYGKNEGLGSIPDLEAGRRITRYLHLLVYFLLGLCYNASSTVTENDDEHLG